MKTPSSVTAARPAARAAAFRPMRRSIERCSAFRKLFIAFILLATFASVGVASADAGCPSSDSAKGPQVRLFKGQLESSTDGVHWTKRPLSFPTYLRGVTSANGLYVAVGGSYLDVPGVVMVSRDGLTWTRREVPTRKNLYAVTHGNGLFVAVGDGGTVCTSRDGLTWKRRDSGTANTLLTSVAFGNGRFVAGGESGALVTSTDGAHWVAGNVGSSRYVSALEFRAGLFAIPTPSGVLLSRDGSRWNSTADDTVPPRLPLPQDAISGVVSAASIRASAARNDFDSQTDAPLNQTITP